MSGDIGNQATCTTCSFSEDFSNYWTAVLYFKHRNGSYKRVPQYPNALLGNLQGGMTIYYLQQDFNSNGKTKITAFKPVRFESSGESLSTTLTTLSGLPHDCW